MAVSAGWCAPWEDSDQPAHPHSLIGVRIVRNICSPCEYDPDQAALMCSFFILTVRAD